MSNRGIYITITYINNLISRVNFLMFNTLVVIILLSFTMIK